MAAVMTYTTLLQDMRDYLERGQTVTDETVYEQLPRLVMLAERRIALELKILGFQKSVTSNFETGVAVVEKPDRWRQTISMNVGNGTGNNTRNQVFPRSYEYIRMNFPGPTDTGLPQFYSDYGWDNILVGPTPDDDYPFELNYYELPALLDDGNQSNWLTEYAPGPLLYACLLEATPFLKDDSRIPVWQGMYDRGLAALNGEDVQKILDRNSKRDKD